MIVLCMISGLALSAKTTIYASGDDESTVERQNNKLTLNTYNGEGQLNSQGTISVDLSSSTQSDITVDLNQYKFVIEKVSADSNIEITPAELSGSLKPGDYFHYDFSYTIPEQLTGDSLEFKVKVVEKDDENAVLVESQVVGIYPYELNNGVLKYYKASKGEKYLMTVESDENLDYWDIPGGGPGNSSVVEDENDHSYDYYLDPNNPSVAVFSPKEGCDVASVEVIPADAGTATKLEYQMYGSYEIKLNAPATVKVTCKLLTEAKDWGKAVDEYVRTIRYSDWFTGDGINNHYFDETAPANDVALITYYQSDILDTATYNETLKRYEIPYDKFVTEAKKHFVNVPDLKSVNIENIISYDEQTNCMIVPNGGIGNPILVTEFVDAKDLGQGRYALHFKVSKDEWEETMPDMTNKDNYHECTLVVEDNGYNNWKYVSFEKGYTYGTGDSQEIPDSSAPTVVEQIQQAPEGSSVNVVMDDTTVVTKDILNAAKGKDVDVVLTMDGYSWTINGKDIDEAKDVDLKVTLDTKAIPEEKITALAGDKKTKQLSLAYDGEFGFKAVLKLNVGKEFAKQYGNLYWYNDNQLSFVDANQVDQDGYLSLTFNHASDYVIVFDSQAHDKKAVSSTQTGDNTSLGLYASALLTSALLLFLVKRKLYQS